LNLPKLSIKLPMQQNDRICGNIKLNFGTFIPSETLFFEHPDNLILVGIALENQHCVIC
jgi:hypothetical protein